MTVPQSITCQWLYKIMKKLNLIDLSALSQVLKNNSLKILNYIAGTKKENIYTVL